MLLWLLKEQMSSSECLSVCLEEQELVCFSLERVPSATPSQWH